MTASQEVIVRCWHRLHDEWEDGKMYFLSPPDDDPYGTVDHAVARELGVPVEHVDEAMVVAGKRQPVSRVV
jgi:hypothetical protein